MDGASRVQRHSVIRIAVNEAEYKFCLARLLLLISRLKLFFSFCLIFVFIFCFVLFRLSFVLLCFGFFGVHILQSNFDFANNVCMFLFIYLYILLIFILPHHRQQYKDNE